MSTLHADYSMGYLQVSNNSFMLIFGAFQIFLSQIRNLNELWLVSVVAAAVSFIYSSIAFGLAVGKTSGVWPQSHKHRCGININSSSTC